MNIPEWEEAKQAVESGTASPLELFVYHNEPAGRDDVEFRAQLEAVLEYAGGLTKRALDEWESCPKCHHPNRPGFAKCSWCKTPRQ